MNDQVIINTVGNVQNIAKKGVLKLALIVAMGSFAMISCSEEKSSDATTTESHEGHDHGIEMASKVYICPMKCEGEKTYSESGSCPKCGMDLNEKE